MKKLYKLGLIVGRFQPLHKGHEYMIRTSLNLCEKTIVFIGSSQEFNTSKNPFSWQYRYELIRKVFNKYIRRKKLYIYPLPDMGYGNSSKWGDYVLSTCFTHTNKYPDLYISGKEAIRSEWLNNVDINVLSLSKDTIEISATECREILLQNNYEKFKNCIPKKLYKEYNYMREVLNEVSNNS